MSRSPFFAAAFVAVLSGPVLAASGDDVAAQLAALEAKEAASQAEIATLRQRIKSLEVSKRSDRKTYERNAASIQASPTGAAMAADRALYKAPIAAVSSWGGFYVGAGYGREKSKIDQGTANMLVLTGGGPGLSTDENVSLQTTRFFNRGHVLAGYLSQFDRFLIGAEGDFSFGERASGARLYVADGGSCGVAVTGTYICGHPSAYGGAETLGHLRAVAGFAFTPNVMAFVAGGAAFARSNDIGSHVGFGVVNNPSAPIFLSADSISQNKLLVGASIGGGVQVKASPNIVARLEYLRDTYDGVVTSGANVQADIGGRTFVMSSPSEKVRITNEAIRGSLIYRFDPNVSPASAAAIDWQQFTTAPALYANTWAGFYVGGGFTQNNYRVSQDGGGTLTIDDSNTPGVDVSRQWDLSRSMNASGQHILLGYRAQWNRFWLGIEGDFNFNSLSSIDNGVKSPGQFGSQSGGGAVTCYTQFLPSNVCIGLSMAGNLTVETKNHLRLTGGFVVTPELSVFATGGLAYGQVQGSLGSSSGGLVYVAPSTPLSGAATVTRTFGLSKLQGTTIGGGFEVKATNDVSVRGEYLRDEYSFKHAPIGGAGFGGTIGTITTNSFAAARAEHQIVNEAYRVSLVYRFWNPQATR